MYPIFRKPQSVWYSAYYLLQLSEFCKAATLLIVTVPGSVEEERTFSAMNFIKDERRNSLSANLSSTLRVYLDKTFTLETFYDGDVSAALNIRRCAVGPGPCPTELCCWNGRPTMPKLGNTGQEWVYVRDKALLRKWRCKLLRSPATARQSQPWSKRFEAPVRGLMWCPWLAQATPGALGKWVDRDCNAALSLQRAGESKWRPLELCRWPHRGRLPAQGKEYPALGFKKLRDRAPKALAQQPVAQ
ncbi:hypothetical protein QJQ45_004653 [Haematococcus lacustris]|nr:hypothetical protein QJQ45_004653 [Haematococcus lacustris]